MAVIADLWCVGVLAADAFSFLVAWEFMHETGCRQRRRNAAAGSQNRNPPPPFRVLGGVAE